jgi:hypothetical protein
MEENATAHDFVELLRSRQVNPERVGRYQAYAADMLVDGLSNAEASFDPDYARLDDVEREAYIAAQASRLAPELFRFVQYWALQRLEFVSDWQRRDGEHEPSP